MTQTQKVQVLLETLKLIPTPHQWRHDVSFDEACTVEPPYTLSCALEKGHIAVMGSYDNRSSVMNRLRIIIYVNYLWRTGIHPIYGFGKHSKTTHAEVVGVLQMAIKSFQ